jgi:hypothetical protein
MFPGRQVRLAGAALAGDVRLPRTRISPNNNESAWPGSTYVWIMWALVENGGEVKWEVID